MYVSFVADQSAKVSIDFTPTEAERMAELLADYEERGSNPFVMHMARELRRDLLRSIFHAKKNEARELYWRNKKEESSRG